MSERLPTLNSADLERPVGQLAQRVVTTLTPTMTVAEALASLRGQDLAQRIVYFYVTDSDRRLLGVVPTRSLLSAPLEQPVGAIMREEVVALPESATVLDACRQFLEHRYLALPVVAEDGGLLGTLDVALFSDELVDYGERQAVRDLFQMVGIHLLDTRRVSPWRAFGDRFPWLLANLLGGLVCALIASRWEAFLDRLVVLALFIPIVLTLAESVGMQSVALTLQALHEGRGLTTRLARAAGQELLTALLLGAASGLVVGLVAWLWRGQAMVGLAIGASILAAMVTVCLLGFALPLVVRRLSLDPALAAGPITLAIGDVLTVACYLNLSGRLLAGVSG